MIRPPQPGPPPQIQIQHATMDLCSQVNLMLELLDPGEDPEVLTEDAHATASRCLAISEHAADCASLWLTIYGQALRLRGLVLPKPQHRTAKVLRQFLDHCRHVGFEMRAGQWLARKLDDLSIEHPRVEEITLSTVHMLHAVAYMLSQQHKPLCGCDWCIMSSSGLNLPDHDRDAVAKRHFGRYVGEYRASIK